MPQCRLLLDANAYFRLARSIRPLCRVEFGAPKYCLHVLKDVDDEFTKSARLQSKFHWVNEQEYQQNRQPPLTLGRADLAAARQAVSYIQSHVRARALGLSPVDIKTLAACAAISCPVVTDDLGMLDVADVFSIAAHTSLSVMKLMLDCGHLKIERVREIARYWAYEMDKPANCDSEYRKHFGEPFPRR